MRPTQQNATARAQVSTNLQKPGTMFVHILIFPALSARKPADAVHELPSMVHQLVLVMRNFSRDGGGQAVRVRDINRAGAHDQQHRCVPINVRDPLQLLHGRLHHRNVIYCLCLKFIVLMRLQHSPGMLLKNII